jgi:hypothetical protein
MKTLNKLHITAIITLAITTPIYAKTLATEHNHDHDQHANASLTLDHGNKWQSDAPLRQGMKSINDTVMKNVDAFHHDKLTKSDAEKIARHINNQVTYLVTNCKLQPNADATLHVIIGELLTGASVLEKEPQSMRGLPAIVKALQQYSEYFEDNDWNGVEPDK